MGCVVTEPTSNELLLIAVGEQQYVMAVVYTMIDVHSHAAYCMEHIITYDIYCIEHNDMLPCI